jgi:hypothetical protein
MSTGVEPASGRAKGGDDASWAYMNLTKPKNKKIHDVDSAASNG